ncbi:MAG: type II secretion system protein [Jatrophihabitantaceae bacterium]
MRALRDRLARRDGTDDRGSTLMELVVGMTVMGIFMTIFTTAVFQMGRTVNKVQAITISAGQVNAAFLRLDKLVRYASAIATSGASAGGNWYIELDNTANGPEVCTQLRIDVPTGQLQQRTWGVTNSVAGTASSWKMLANGISNGTATAGSNTQPFVVAASTASSPFQQLTVTLVVNNGGATSATSASQITFTAVNSVASASTNATTCQQKGRP